MDWNHGLTTLHTLRYSNMAGATLRHIRKVKVLRTTARTVLPTLLVTRNWVTRSMPTMNMQVSSRSLFLRMVSIRWMQQSFVRMCQPTEVCSALFLAIATTRLLTRTMPTRSTEWDVTSSVRLAVRWMVSLLVVPISVRVDCSVT